MSSDIELCLCKCECASIRDPFQLAYEQQPYWFTTKRGINRTNTRTHLDASRFWISCIQLIAFACTSNEAVWVLGNQQYILLCNAPDVLILRMYCIQCKRHQCKPLLMHDSSVFWPEKKLQNLFRLQPPNTYRLWDANICYLVYGRWW